ncbi:hypothetical protein AM228_09845 [Planktothricoides sp. SR001]|nr:hypothetical protein AM228_09845 [Planktothricoides sp. SR001]
MANALLWAFFFALRSARGFLLEKQDRSTQKNPQQTSGKKDLAKIYTKDLHWRDKKFLSSLDFISIG